MWAITKEWKFEASHSLTLVPFDHKCNRDHGHSYRVRVELRSNELNAQKMIVDYAVLDETFGKFVEEKLDHRNLNNVVKNQFETTAENLAQWLFNHCKQYQWGRFLYSVTVFETASTSATYFRV